MDDKPRPAKRPASGFTMPLPPTAPQQVAVVPPDPPPSPIIDLGTRLGDFAIRAIRARSAPAMALAAAKCGLLGIFGSMLMGVKADASGVGPQWSGTLDVTGLETGQMLIVAGTVVVLAGFDLYAYLRRLRQDEKSQDRVMDSARDPEMPLHLRERLVNEVIEAARSRR